MPEVDHYVTLAMARHVQGVLNYCRMLSSGSDKTLIEQKVYLPGVGYGTVDFGTIKGVKKSKLSTHFDRSKRDGKWLKCESLTVLDLKYGAGVEVSAETPQTPYYALGAMFTLKLKPKIITCIVDQPRLGERKAVDFTFHEIMELYATLLAARKLVDLMFDYFADPKHHHLMIFKPGSHCRFCKGREQCETLGQYVIENGPMGREHFAVIREKPTGADKDRYIQGVVNLMDSKQLSDYYEWCDIAVRTGNAVKEKMTSLVAQGFNFDSLKLVQGRRSYKWKDERKAAAALALTGLIEEDIYTKQIISVSKARQLTNVNEHLVISGRTKPSLVPLTDRRRSLEDVRESSASEGFDDMS